MKHIFTLFLCLVFSQMILCGCSNSKCGKIEFYTDNELYKTVYTNGLEKVDIPEIPEIEGYEPMYNNWSYVEHLSNSLDRYHDISGDSLTDKRFLSEFDFLNIKLNYCVKVYMNYRRVETHLETGSLDGGYLLSTNPIYINLNKTQISDLFAYNESLFNFWLYNYMEVYDKTLFIEICSDDDFINSIDTNNQNIYYNNFNKHIQKVNDIFNIEIGTPFVMGHNNNIVVYYVNFMLTSKLKELSFSKIIESNNFNFYFKIWVD